jgi:glutamate synthase (NADPH/NADH) small chain
MEELIKPRKLPPAEYKERSKIKRQKMPEQDPAKRRHNFFEVNLGFTAEQAMAEARRCLLCQKVPCASGCPVHVKIPQFIEAVANGDFLGALSIIKEDDALPAVTGRVCPQEVQCEESCTHCKTSGEAVGIGRIERFVADLERASTEKCHVAVASPTGKKIAVIGSGPGGLTVAADCARYGHEVHIFEALHKAGGVLVYGIPEFRLPKDIVDYEIAALKKMGVQIHMNTIVGRTFTVDDLKGAMGFDGVFIGIGAGLPVFMNIPGENLSGVYSANEYLTRSNLMKAYLFPKYDTPIIMGKNVAVVGGGNVAMDSVRTALRLGAENAYLVYRRSSKEMPARTEEIHHAEEEGVNFQLLTNPIEVLDDGKGRVRALRCVKMQLGEADADGRCKVSPMCGTEFEIAVDTVVIAIGTSSNPLLTATMPELKLNKWGYIEADENGRTNMPLVYAGGDIVTGSATVILAMGAGRKAAKAIHEDLTGKKADSLQTCAMPT